MDRPLPRDMLNASEIIRFFLEGQRTASQTFFDENGGIIDRAAWHTAHVLADNGKLLVCGMGSGKICASLLVSRLINPVFAARPSLAALNLDREICSELVSGGDWQNESFARQIEALGHEGDCLLIFAGNGLDVPLFRALLAASAKNIFRVVLADAEANYLAEHADLLVKMSAASSDFILETQIAFIHVYCQLMEYYLFENPGELLREPGN